LKILDLGCGFAKVEGAIGVDITRLQGVDVVSDLSCLPFPFAENTFNAIYLNDVIEHLPNTMATMEEVYRISRPNAKVYIRVVNWNSHYTAMDPTHLHAYTENSFDFFGKRLGRSYYSKARFEVARIGFQYNALAERVIRNRRLLKLMSFYLNNILEGLSFELSTVKERIAQVPLEEGEQLFSVLRCPYCLGKELKSGETDGGRLLRIDDQWLVCQEKGCNRKYPILDGTPILLSNEGEKWISMDKKSLPHTAGKEYPLISTGETSTSSDVSFLYRCAKGEEIGFEEFTARGLAWFKRIKIVIKWVLGILLFALLIVIIFLVLQKSIWQ
jgi:uncharacterized protein YbaR (Trm112 family)